METKISKYLGQSAIVEDDQLTFVDLFEALDKYEAEKQEYLIIYPNYCQWVDSEGTVISDEFETFEDNVLDAGYKRRNNIIAALNDRLTDEA